MKWRSWILFGLIFIFRTGWTQVSLEGVEVKMGLVPVTEMYHDEKWITVYTTVPVDLICGNSFVYIQPGAYRVRKNIFDSTNTLYTQTHDFVVSHKYLKVKISEGIEILKYTDEGIVSLGLKDVILFKLNEKCKVLVDDFR